MQRHSGFRFGLVVPLSIGCFICAPRLWAADTTPPTTPVVTDGGTSTTSTTELSFSFTTYDPESSVVYCEYVIRQDSVAGSIVASRNGGCSNFNGVLLGDLPLALGKSYYIGVRAENSAALWSAWGYSDGILVTGADTTPPTTPVVTDDGQYTTSTTQLHATWSSTDPESGIAEYQYQIRQKSPTGPIVANWTSTGTGSDVTVTGLISFVGKTKVNGLLNGTNYYFGVKAKNGAGLWSAIGWSDGIKVDATPPSAVTVSDDGATTSSATQLHATWTTSADSESGVVDYQYQIRQSSTNGSIIRDWTSAGITTQVTATGLSLTNGSIYYIGIRAKNGAGLFATAAYSDGITVQMADTTPPTAPGQPTEGSPDQDYSNTGSYTIFWAAATDAESGITGYELQERRGTAGTWTTLSSTISGTSFPVSGRLNATMYFYRVRAKNGVGLWSVFSPVSDGITVDTQPPTVSAIGITTITASAATLNWTTNESASCTVRCGTVSPPTPQCATTPLSTSHTATLSGLAADTIYYTQVSCQDQAGNTGTNSASFKTQPITVPMSPSLITVNGRQLMLQRRNPDGTLAPATPYIIRGVDWSPASKDTATSPTDANNANVRRPEFGKWYQTDLPLMKAMNVNTVRTFLDFGVPGDANISIDGKAILDEFYRNGIMVIMTVDNANNDTTRIQQAVSYYKDHPAIFAWSLGSEWNINQYFTCPNACIGLGVAAQRTQTAATLIKTLDTNHPVVSSYGEFDLFSPTGMADLQNFVNTVCPSVDVWSFNLYRGDTFGFLPQQWTSIGTKPMFIGEFGIDAFHADAPVNPATGIIDEAAQAQWDLSLWNDLARHLSAQDPSQIALGGTVFEWNDEWWKVSPWGQQDTNGWFSDGFPDGMGNEEYFGIVDINRTTPARQVYGTLKTAFDPTYVPPAPSKTLTVRAYSAGGTVPATNWANGIAKLYKGKTLLYAKYGGAGGGRGFNVLALDAATGQPLPLPKNPTNFDTWFYGDSAQGPAAMQNMIDFLNGLPNGTIILLAVADEAGLTLSADQPCTHKTYPNLEVGLRVLEALGSTQIRNYCYWDSWAMVTVKGEVDASGQPKARAEQLGKAVIGNGADASAETTLTLQ